jgi:hypothetical protein
VPRWWREGHLAEVDAEQAEGEKGEGVACFFQARKGIFFRLGEMLEEAGDLGQTKLARMAFAVEEDEVTGAVGEALARLGPAEMGQGGPWRSWSSRRGGWGATPGTENPQTPRSWEGLLQRGRSIDDQCTGEQRRGPRKNGKKCREEP